MIVVIADDITGAAELAGIGWRDGLRTRLCRLPEHGGRECSQDEPAGLAGAERPDIDLLVIDSDSREIPVEQAIERLERLGRHASVCGVRLLYKKTDSVLRGNVQAEIVTLLKCTDRSAALLVAQNPSLKRVIRDDQYLIDGVPLHETSLADDPQWPARTSDPVQLVKRSRSIPVRLRSVDEPIADGELAVGRAAGVQDVRAWAQRVNARILPAGGSDFFQALLEYGPIPSPRANRRAAARRGDLTLTELTAGPVLVVSGSASADSREAFKRAGGSSFVLCPMPETLFQADPPAGGLVEDWGRQIGQALASRGRAWMAINRPITRQPNRAANLKAHLTACVQCVLKEIDVALLLVEGGATCSALLRALSIDDFEIIGQLQRGVVALRANTMVSPVFVLKPGSYSWPELIWSGELT